MATDSSILAWRIPWTEEPGRLQSMGPKELDTTERLALALPYVYIYIYIYIPSYMTGSRCVLEGMNTSIILTGIRCLVSLSHQCDGNSFF